MTAPESDVLLRNLFEHYIHDAEWFEIDTITTHPWYGRRATTRIWQRLVIQSLASPGWIGSGVAGRDWRPGDWLVRVLEANAPAASFWRTAISSYSGGSWEEEGRIVNGLPWRFFRFVSQVCIQGCRFRRAPDTILGVFSLPAPLTDTGIQRDAIQWPGTQLPRRRPHARQES